MEIMIRQDVLCLIVVFKIDLIVWKYQNKEEKVYENVKFKIDLIVWKYPQMGLIYSCNKRFKIDLIVWK